MKEEISSDENDPELEKVRRKKIMEMQIRMSGQGSGGKTLTTPIVVEDSSFDQLVRENRLMVVDFWAPWCGPCRMVAPIVDELARDYAGKIVFGKLNVDENPQTATRFGVMSIPTLLVMKNGEEVDRIVSAVSKQDIEATLRRYSEKQ